ncbi:hypothetical protein KJ780_04815, partial [Candidatus Micrarchaeota archaeon]|nr:hypothetical protein [Candidatus Micrarchaeota archaeon]
MNWNNALEYLEEIRKLGFREDEKSIPKLVEQKSTSIPDAEDFENLIDVSSDSEYQAQLLSGYLYTIKGCIEFSLVSEYIGNGLQKDLDEWKKGNNYGIAHSFQENVKQDNGIALSFARKGDMKTALKEIGNPNWNATFSV